jgi:hypothetical protein
MSVTTKNSKFIKTAVTERIFVRLEENALVREGVSGKEYG